jgi:VanZ family protein
MTILAILKDWWAGTWGRRLPPVAWMGLIFYLSSQPDLPSAPEPLLDLLLKKTAHAFVYAVLAALFHRAVNGSGVHWKRPPPLPSPPSRGRVACRDKWGLLMKMNLAPWFLAVLYAATDEIHQTFVPGRSGRLTDVLIDAAGAAVGVLFMAWLRRRARS